MNTLENNKLIAEFMGLVVSNREDYHSSLHTNVDADLKYHTSWDWLMPVVEKIEDIRVQPDDNETYSYHRFRVDMNICQCEITESDNSISFGDNHNKLASTYDAVVEFIKQQNKKA
jgi:hypothetical protein